MPVTTPFPKVPGTASMYEMPDIVGASPCSQTPHSLSMDIQHTYKHNMLNSLHIESSKNGFNALSSSVNTHSFPEVYHAGYMYKELKSFSLSTERPLT